MATSESALRQFQSRGSNITPTGLRTNTSANAITKIRGVLNLVAIKAPRTKPNAMVRPQDWVRLQYRTCMAVTKVIRATAPSLQVIEKLAIRDGEKAKKASAKFAAPSENRRLAVIHRR